MSMRKNVSIERHVETVYDAGKRMVAAEAGYAAREIG